MSLGRHRQSSTLWRILPITIGGALVAAALIMAVTGHDARILRLAIAFALAVAVFSLVLMRGRERDHEQELTIEAEDHRFEQERLAAALNTSRAEAERQQRRADEHAHTAEHQRASLEAGRARIAELEVALRTSDAARERLVNERDHVAEQASMLRAELTRLHALQQQRAAATRAAGALPTPQRYARAAKVLGSLAYLREQQAAAAEEERTGRRPAAPAAHRGGVPLGRPAATVSVRSTYAPVPIGPAAIIPAIAAQLEAVARRTGTFPGFVAARQADATAAEVAVGGASGVGVPEPGVPGAGDQAGTRPEGDGEEPEADADASAAPQRPSKAGVPADLVDLTLHDDTQRMDLMTPARRHA